MVYPLVTQTHEPYEYAGDDPVNNTDPSGLCWPSWACGVEKAVSNVAKKALPEVSRVAGDVQLGADVGTLANLGAGDLIGAAFGAGISEVAGTIGTASDCLDSAFGGSATPCLYDIAVYLGSSGFSSSPMLNDLYNVAGDVGSQVRSSSSSVVEQPPVTLASFYAAILQQESSASSC